jgi:hypothetical protein
MLEREAPSGQWSFSKRMMRRRFLNFALCLVSVLVTIVGVEILLRATAYGQKHFQWRSHGFPQFYHCPDLINGFDICPNFPTTEFNFPDYIEMYGMSYTVSSNEVGCRDRRMDRETPYVLLLGDSFTWADVPLESAFGSLVENLIGVRVLKCGVSGYGTRQELNKLEQVVKQVGPPSVIVVGYFVGNDLIDDFLFPQYTVVGGYVLGKMGLAGRNAASGERWIRTEEELKEEMAKRFPREAASPISNAKDFLVKHSFVYNLLRSETGLRQVAFRLGLADPPPASSAAQRPENEAFHPFHPIEEAMWLRQSWKLHLDNMKQLKRAADKHNAKLLMVIIPTVEQVYEYRRPSGTESLNWEYPNSRLREFFGKEGISYLDLLPEFRRYANLQPKTVLDARGDLYWPRDIHLNVKGNQLAAFLISRYMLEEFPQELPNKDKGLFDVTQLLSSFPNLTDAPTAVRLYPVAQ